MSKNPALPAALSESLAHDGGKLERAFSVERASVNPNDRTVTMAFASELAYERWWGIEILECTSTAMRQNRMRSGANLLCDHNTRDVIGVVESVEIGADRVVRAVVRFGRSARAEEVFQDVIDGIRRNVSVGYAIHKAVLVETKDGVETYRVTDWEPFEISLVSVPADPTVGVGRSISHSDVQADPAPVLTPTPNQSEVRSMTEAVVTPAPVAITAAAPVIQVESRNHAAEITKIAASLPGGAELAMRSIQAGHTVEQFQLEAIRALASKPIPTSDIGLSEKEVRQFSVVRAIHALANPSDMAAQRAAAFEFEASKAVGDKMGKSARGFFVPTDVQKRDLLVGTPTAGGNLVATELLSGSFIDLLRNAMVINRMGTRMLSGLVGQIAIPKQTGAATAYWVAENGAPTESQQTIGQVTMSPKTVGAFTDISRKLTLQSSLSVEQMVNQDLATVLGLAIQQAAINGTGASNQPSGLLTLVTPSVIGGTNGLAPTWAHIVALETNVAVGNADIGTLGYLTNTKVRGKLKTTEKFAGSNGQPVYADGTTPLNGYMAGITNAVPSNLVKGTSGATASAILFGNFADLVIGMWGSLDIMVDPYTGSTAGTVRVVALQDVDVAVRNVESFATMVDALTV
ncbi:phage major capsid protein [Hydrogenophaga sp.]|uniref:phage major capsid protein n=1 Tax=Hydrogenophaga sp. TaxID=1904254 RepID=UPI0027307393|nr:phage major capsid protein [Hydrogenophaga sp.]MDP1686880.1 phage major capsid protein [Hydrogenophaga sp.]